MHAIATAAAWQAESRTARCPRTPLREATTGDGSRFLEPLVDPDSTESRCLKQVGELFGDLYTPCDGNSSCATKLAALKPHPEVVAMCAALYDDIERVAHAAEACSPMRAGTYDINSPSFPPIMRLADSIRIRIAPLVVRGELDTAARQVIDAMRFAQDYGRHTSLVGAMYGATSVDKLFWALDEILVDPRLTRDDARAITHDLDVLIATNPTFVETIHGEVAEFPSLLRSTGTASITGDSGQDFTLWMLGKERERDEFDRACGATPLRTCAAVLEPAGRYEEDWYDFDPLIRSFDDDATVRERIIDRIAAGFPSFLALYARGFERRHIDFVARRMQAELRAMDDCNLARLELPDDATLDADGTLQPPAWAREREHEYTKPFRLRCVP
jgi:hypothetical protein